MFGIFMWIVFVLGVIGIAGVCIWDEKSTIYNHETLKGSICVISILLIVFSVVGGIIYIGNQAYYTSPDNYYDTLVQKQEITSKLETYNEEIHNVLSGDIAIIDFTKREELIELNSQIEKYNYKIIKHRKYKESFWFSKLYNKDVANLELLPAIFNVIEE